MGIFGKKGWEKAPSEAISTLKKRINPERFALLGQVMDKYKLFNWEIFSNQDSSTFLIVFPGLLAVFGNNLAVKGGDSKDAETLLLCAVDLDQKSTARFTLALLYYLRMSKDQAKKYALECRPYLKELSDDSRVQCEEILDAIRDDRIET